METIESKEKLGKKLNVVIMGFGELGQGFYDMLKETNSNVYVVSISGKNNKQYDNIGIKPYNRYEGFPIKYEDIDAVLLCCRTGQLEAVKTLIPEEVLPKVVDKFIAFQNGFGVRDELLRLFGKSVPRCIPYLSFKNYDGKNIRLSFARTSPIKGEEIQNVCDLMETVNDYTSKNFGKYLFEGVDSIALQREGEYKAMINTVLNSLCVVYRSDVEQSIEQFKKEFGAEAIKNWAKEISQVENVNMGNSVFETNPGEVEYKILHLASKFAKEKPSTYQQYYMNSQLRGKILSDDDHLLGYLVNKAKKNGIKVPLSDEIRQRMKNIEKEINQSLKN